EEQANRESLRAIQRAFREAMLILPREEYDWFDIQSSSSQDSAGSRRIEQGLQSVENTEDGAVMSGEETREEASAQRQFFHYAGPLHTVVISPTTSTVGVGQSRRFRALPRDRSRRRVEEDLTFAWEVVEGGGTLSSVSDQEISFAAPDSPALV